MVYREIKGALKKSVVHDIVTFFRQQRELRDWNNNGKSTRTPHAYKQKVVLQYADRFSISTLVESGTYLGFMVNATKGRFERIYSIELDEALYLRAKKKFFKFGHISIYQGDSGNVLPQILSHTQKPCLFWLDAHYSGGISAKGDLETPVMAELKHILTHSFTHSLLHVILIDDARCFIGANDYPTLQGVEDLVSAMQPSLGFEVKNDIIRICP
jgi:hypothetical protein